MKYQLKKLSLARRLPCLGLALAISLALPLPALAASVALATQPLATSTTSLVKPNLLLVLDNSGSMAWDHMPDDSSDGGSSVSFIYGYYGLRSSQCNQVYYDPAITYSPPAYADGTSYPDASFTGAWDNGFDTGAGTTDLSTGFQASQSLSGDSSGQSAYYYSYSGAQTTALQKNYNSTTNTFYNECHSAQYASPGTGVFTKISLTNTAAATTATIVASCSSCTSTSVSGITVDGAQIMSGTAAGSTTTSTVATNIRDQINLCTNAQAGNCATVGGHGYTATVSGSTVTLAGLADTATSLIVTQTGSMTLAPTIFPVADATKLQNFANWYSYYHTRMLMMKTATGRAFSSINQNYRVGLMKISSSSTPTVYVDTFSGTHRTNWYNALYNTTASGSTPLRTALSDAGMYYAGQLSGTDPLQYSCQQNFTLLSTDGYWNTGNGYKEDGSTAVGNQDGTMDRPYYDGSTLGTQRSTSQIQKTQTQVRQSTSQLQKRTEQIQSSTSNLQSSTSNLQSTGWPLLSSTSNLQSSAWPLLSSTSQLQSSTSNLQSSTSTLQQSTMYLQTRTSSNSGSSWTSWAGVASCTWDTNGSSRAQCRYGVTAGGTTVWSAGAAVWNNTASCTTSFSTGTSNGTTWTGNGTNCQYSAYTSPANVGSCTTVAQSGGSPYTVGTATNCSYTAYSTPVNVGSCTTVAKSTGSPYTVGTATNCSYTAYTAAAPVGSCTYQGKSTSSPYTVGTATTCSYGATPTVATVTSCTTVAKTTSTADGTAWDPAAKTCAYAAYSAAAPASSCTYMGQSASSPYAGPAVTCSYGAIQTTTVTSCTPAAKTTSTADGTVWNPAAVSTCAYTAYSAPANVSSCTDQAQSTAAPYVGPAATCSYTAYSAFANASSCTPALPSSGSPYTVGAAVNCQTTDTGWGVPDTQLQTRTSSDSGVSWTSWSNAASCTVDNSGTNRRECQTITFCTPSVSGGQTVTCNTVNTGPTLVDSCSAASPNSGNSYTTTTCATTTLVSAQPVASCTAEAASAVNNHTATTCYTAVTGPTAGSCTAAAASSSNSWTATTCSTYVSGGGTSDNLADIAMYYYQTDLRTPALLNCGTPAATGPLCDNNVFMSANDRNIQQHMTTFTLGLGASGWMNYSSSYLSDNSGDYFAVKTGSTTNLAPSTITVTGSGSTSVSSITVNGVQLMSGTSTASTDNNTVASNIATKITQNSFSATASGNVITITGPASAASYTPVITQSGAMVLTAGISTPACSWQANGTACNWPIPGMSGSNGLIANIDDLWHAGVNGRGAYFSATNPTTLAAGLSGALAGINARKGSAAAAATSTLNPVAGNNSAFVASYTTVTWKGNLEARGVNTITGQTNENADWCVENVPVGNCPAPGSIIGTVAGSTTTYNCVTPNAVVCNGGTMSGSDCYVPVATACTGTMNSKVSTSSDTRTIKTANSAGTALINFDAAYAAANPANFSAAHISTLSQWASLDTAQQAAAEGISLINYLRGQYQYEDRSTNLVADRLYRYREAVLGDALESQPAFIGSPVFSYPYTGYSAYKTAQAGRAGTVYMGANDGMMHAFTADTGIERWAYVPSMVISDMWILADKTYASLHRNFVNGSPITSDIYCPGNCGGAVDVTYGDSASWRTILVAGLNGGGRGYFALDITDPVTPTLLWEFTMTTGIGKFKDDDVGYSFGQPIITRKADGTWVVLVTSGYNNTSPGDGKGYLFVLNANTGAIISKIATGVGSTTTPSGLARIAAWNDEPAGNQAGYVYGGDLLGNVWRFNINSTTTAAIGTGDAFKFAVLYSETAATNPQPITTTPILGLIATKRVIFIGTGKYLETGDLTNTQIQTQYAIKDADATTTLVNPRTVLVRQTLTNAGASRTVSNNSVDFYTGRGWYVDLPDSGERINIDSKLVQGTLLVPSIVPSNTACAPGGYGWLNFFNFQTGGAVNPANSLAAVKYDATIVGVNVIYVQGMPKVGVVTSDNPTPELNTGVPFSGSAAGFSGKRVIWRELLQ